MESKWKIIKGKKSEKFPPLKVVWLKLCDFKLNIDWNMNWNHNKLYFHENYYKNDVEGGTVKPENEYLKFEVKLIPDETRKTSVGK